MGTLLDLARIDEDDIEVDNEPLPVSPIAERIAKMAAKLEGDKGLLYAVQSHDDLEPDAVILTMAIRGKGTCELRIAKSRYDGVVLLELIDKHTFGETLQ